jgi:hypothetical protein
MILLSYIITWMWFQIVMTSLVRSSAVLVGIPPTLTSRCYVSGVSFERVRT